MSHPPSPDVLDDESDRRSRALDEPGQGRTGSTAPARHLRIRHLLWVGLTTVVVAVLVLAGQRVVQPPYDQVPYDWETVEVNGGGWVTGLVTTADGARYARTDVGGAYRWDEAGRRWQQMITYDGVDEPEQADYYVESLAVAPSDDEVLYVAVGDTLEARTGRILRSDDGGRTWEGSSRRFTIHGNAEWRQAGARLAVDPQDPDVVLFGSRRDGLFRSSDGGRSWQQRDSLPAAEVEDDEAPAGVTFVAFDPTGKAEDRSSGVYAGVEGVGVLRSEDGGRSWDLAHATPGGVPRDAEVAADGRLYTVVAGRDAGVVRLSAGGREAETISPGGSPAVVAVDPTDPDHLFVGDEGVRDGHLWRSTDGGDTWDELAVGLSSDRDVWPLQSDLEQYMSAGELVFDRQRPGTLWLAEGMGVWRSDDLDDGEVTWDFASTGIEELVTNDAVVPPGHDPLTAHWDRNVVRHPSGAPADLPLTGRFNSAWSLDVAPANPPVVVAVVDDHRFCCNEDGLAAGSGLSRDGGRTWSRFGSLDSGSHPQELAFGNIAVSGGDEQNLVWVPSNGGRIHYSFDAGQTWTPAEYPGGEPHFAYYLHRDVLAADPSRPGTFYVLDADGVFRSTDGGVSWERRASRGLPGSDALRFNATLAVVPGQDDLVMTTGLLDEGSHGLFRSGDGGDSWQELPTLQDVGRVGFAGAPGPDGTYAMFATARVGDRNGLWRSTDDGVTWALASEAPAGRHQGVTVLSGMPGSAEAILVGFTGTGAVLGGPREPAPSSTP